MRDITHIQETFKYQILFGLLFLLMTLFSISGLSNDNLQFQHLSVDEGLKNSKVVAVVQDQKGFMWFATKDGLEKFDGSNVKHYSLVPEGIDFSDDDILNCLITSETYDLLCGTQSGKVFHYNRELDQFIELTSPPKDQTHFSVLNLACEDSTVWLGTSIGLFRLASKNGKLERIKAVKSRTSDLLLSKKYHLWVGTTNGLFCVNKRTGNKINFKKVSEECANLEKDAIQSLSFGKQEQLYVGTHATEIYLIRKKRDTLKYIRHKKIWPGRKIYPVNDIVQTTNNNLAVSMDGFGICILNQDLEILQKHTVDVDNKHAISSDGVYQLYYSKDSIFWATTYGGGVNYSDPNRKKISLIQHLPNIKNSLRNNAAKSVIEYNGEIWFGTKTGISIWNPQTDNWKHIPKIEIEPRNIPYIQSFCIDKDNHIWAATYGSGLIRSNPRSGEYTQFRKNGQGKIKINTNHLYSVYTDKRGRIWTGGIWGDVSVIDYSRQLANSVKVTTVKCFYEDDKGPMYIGTSNGLYLVNTTTLVVHQPKLEILVDSKILTILKDPESDNLFLGCEGRGIIQWNPKTQEIQTFTTKDGLASNHVQGILSDEDGNLWISTTGGICSYKRTSNTFDKYDYSDGFANTEFETNVHAKLQNGQMIFGGSNGFSMFFPNDIAKSKNIPELAFTEFKLFGKGESVNENGPLFKSIDIQKEIILEHNQNSVAFGFVSINYTNPTKSLYQWKMEGLEKEWSVPGNQREAVYPNLPPGEYTFKVRSSNYDGIWGDNTRKIEVTVLKPFWATTVAFIIYALILLGILYSGFQYYQSVLHERHSREKEQFFINIAHDLRTPLALIKLPLEKITQETPAENQANKNISSIQRNVDRLTRMVDQLLDFQKADLKKTQLQVAEFQFVEFIQKRVDSFAPLAKQKEISLQFTPPLEEIDLWFDSHKMDKIIFNLLSNALKYTPRGGRVFVEVSKTKNKCTVSVTDTGEGIPKDQQKNIFKRYYRASNAINSQETGSGVGLMLTKELVEMHKGSIGFTSEEGEGSVFTFEIPLGSEHFTKEQICSEAAVSPESVVAVPEEPVPATSSKEGPKILIVEDNSELRNTLAEDLGKTYQVITAADGKEGLEQAQKFSPNLIISDVMMPNMNGHQLCSHIKNDVSTCHIPVILLTALSSVEYKKEGLEQGADAYVEKPFEMSLLKIQIENLLKNRALLKKKFLLPTTAVDESVPTDTDREFLEKVQQLIIDKLDSPDLSVQSIAGDMGMSRPVLYRKIKALTDLSPQHFLTTVKLKEAARLMKETGLNISETAYRTGFSDPKYFSLTFKKQFGVSPSQYIKSGVKKV